MSQTTTAAGRTAHKQGPWRVGGDDGYEGVPFIEIVAGEYGPTYEQICDVRSTLNEKTDEWFISEVDRATADFIVRACNSHPDLVKVLEGLCDYFIPRAKMDVVKGGVKKNLEHNLLDQIEAALAAAKTGGAA